MNAVLVLLLNDAIDNQTQDLDMGKEQSPYVSVPFARIAVIRTHLIVSHLSFPKSG